MLLLTMHKSLISLTILNRYTNDDQVLATTNSSTKEITLNFRYFVFSFSQHLKIVDTLIKFFAFKLLNSFQRVKVNICAHANSLKICEKAFQKQIGSLSLYNV